MTSSNKPLLTHSMNADVEQVQSLLDDQLTRENLTGDDVARTLSWLIAGGILAYENSDESE